MIKDSFKLITDDLVRDVQTLKFAHPITHVYNPLIYARTGYDTYCERYGTAPKQVLLLGMNPGPWGMAQTGVPFGDVQMVQNLLKIQAEVRAPQPEHPKRPISGFECSRSEVSGQRLWGWVKERFGAAQTFFKRFWVANYCPLVFMEQSGRNHTPDRLPKEERTLLFEACDRALDRTVHLLKPDFVIGIGQFAYKRAERLFKKNAIVIGRVIHPSPANPKANRGWADQVEKQLKELGLQI